LAKDPRFDDARVIHPLLPARHFSGRKVVLERLWEWASGATAPAVVAIVAPGGTGKTALVRRFIESVSCELFVWSFYDNPSMDAFVGMAYAALASGSPHRRTRLELLKHALRASSGVTIILDGVEAVQVPDPSGTRHGRFESHDLALLLRSAASGYLGNTRFLLTSRFPISDLSEWEGYGAQTIHLGDLDEDDAIELLRRSGVEGDEKALRHWVDRAGRHALTLSVLAAWQVLAGGNPAPDTGPLRLDTLLDLLRSALNKAERTAMSLLSLFPQGADSHLVAEIVATHQTLRARAGGMLDGEAFRRLLARLEQHGLVFSYQRDGRATFTAHPVVRDHFARDLDEEHDDVHEVAADALEARLAGRPGGIERERLASVAPIVFHTIRAKRRDDAHRMYVRRMGGYPRLALKEGLYDLGRQTVSWFSSDGTPAGLDSVSLLNDWALFAQDLGDTRLARAARDRLWAIAWEHARLDALDAVGFSGLEPQVQAQVLAEMTTLGHPNVSPVFLSAFANRVARVFGLELEAPLGHPHTLELAARVSDGLVGREFSYLPDGALALVALNSAHLDLLTGRLERCVRMAGAAWRLDGSLPAGRLLARAQHLMGDPLAREHDFVGRSRRTQSLPSLWRVASLVDRGAYHTAETEARHILAVCVNEEWAEAEAFLKLELCRAYIGLARLDACARTLDEASVWFSAAGQAEGVVRAHLLAGRLGAAQGDLEDSVGELNEAVQLAEACGFQLDATRAMACLADVLLRRGETDRAHEVASGAMSVALACHDAWGRAEAGHPLGVAVARLGRGTSLLEQALELRRDLAHPGVSETEAALREFSW
jgi:hypothetical protein